MSIVMRDRLRCAINSVCHLLVELTKASLPFLFPYAETSENARRGEMDGIRGWAALSVLICHVRYNSLGDHPGDTLFFNLFAKAILSVDVFFVLSGDALSLGTTKKGGKGLSPAVVLKRIPRLSGTIMMGMILLFLFHTAGIVCKTRPAVNGSDWFYNFSCPSIDLDNYNFLHYMKFAWMDVFATQGKAVFDTFMWPIEAELRGSIVVFAICALLPRIKHRVWIVGAMALYSAHNFGVALSCFVFGVLLGELRALGVFDKLHASKRGRIAMGIAVLLIPAIPIHWGEGSTAILAKFDPIGIVDFLWKNVALFAVFALYASKDAVAFMNNPISQFLGHISFALYVVHHHIMSTLLAFLVERYADETGLPSQLNKNWISAVTITVAIGVAFLVYLIEKQYLRLLDRGAKLFLITEKTPEATVPRANSCALQHMPVQTATSSSGTPGSSRWNLEEDFDLEAALNWQNVQLSPH